MNRMMTLLGGGFLAAGLTVASAFGHEGEDHSAGAEVPQVTIQGELIDTACFVASDGDAKGADHAECARTCMASGIPAAILPEGKEAKDMLFLLTNPAVLAPYAAKTIKVEGTPHPDMHAIDVQKIYVQEGADWKEVELNDEHHNMMEGSEHHGHEGHDGHHDQEGQTPDEGAAGSGHQPDEDPDAHQH